MIYLTCSVCKSTFGTETKSLLDTLYCSSCKATKLKDYDSTKSKCSECGFAFEDKGFNSCPSCDRLFNTIRGTNAKEFFDRVIKHIETYTVPQYGDSPEDQVETWSADDCIKQI